MAALKSARCDNSKAHAHAQLDEVLAEIFEVKDN